MCCACPIMLMLTSIVFVRSRLHHFAKVMPSCGLSDGHTVYIAGACVDMKRLRKPLNISFRTEVLCMSLARTIQLRTGIGNRIKRIPGARRSVNRRFSAQHGLVWIRFLECCSAWSVLIDVVRSCPVLFSAIRYWWMLFNAVQYCRMVFSAVQYA